MPKKLSLKKAPPLASKAQKPITQFFKVANGSDVQLAKSLCHSHVELEKKNIKRKTISPEHHDGGVLKENHSTKANTTIDNNPKKQKKENLIETTNLGHLELRKSPRKHGTTPNTSVVIEKEVVSNDERSPLSPANHILQVTPKNSPKKQLEENEQDLGLHKKKISSPPKLSMTSENSEDKTLPVNGSVLSPLRRSPRIANLRSPYKSPVKNSLCNGNQNRAKVALDFASDNNEMFGDDFDIADLDEILSDELDLSVMQRCEVIAIDQNAFNIVIRVKGVSDKCATCVIEGIWQDTPLCVGEILSLIAIRGPDQRYIINNSNGLLVLRPDHLMSSTSVVAGVFCRRKAVLQERFRGIDSANSAMTIGTLIHELVQKALTQKLSKASELRKEAEKILRDSILMLYDAGISIEEALSSMEIYIPSLVDFMQLYVLENNSKMNNSKAKWNGHVNELLDIEENVCCPQLGVKGRIDATLKVTIHEREGSYQTVVPLELKSGRASGSAEHRGQLVLYSMMMALQKGEDPTKSTDQKGLLLYLKDKVDLREVKCGYPERRDLVMLRNQLVQYLALPPQQTDKDDLVDIEDVAHVYRQQLPDPVHHDAACSKCPYLTVCSLYLWNTEGPQVSGRHPLVKLRQEAIGHLSPSHIKYFLHWAALLKLEEKGQMMSSSLHTLWTEPPEKRARQGKCVYNLTLKSTHASNDRFLHIFQHGNSIDSDNTKGGLRENEFAIVSVENRPWVAAGVISVINSEELHILLERDLSRRNSKSVLYQIDCYESYTGIIQNLSHLAALMEDNDRAHKLRRLIIDKETPEFELKQNREVYRLGAKLMKGLNKEQQRAVFRAVMAKDYMILQGLPGTGKTETISVLIQMLVALKKSVLVSAHTHSAVDTVLSRLPQSMRVLRLGSSSRVSPALANRCEQHLTASCKTPEELDQLYNSMEVVGVTCLGAGHPLVGRRAWAVALVDEAAQAGGALAVLRAARTVLAGDRRQLPPLVRSAAARKLGMEETLFTRLIDTGGTETLTLQYRMNSAITKLANEVAYEGQLKCATDLVRDATLHINIDMIKETQPEWLVKSCGTEMEYAVVFLDTGAVVTSKNYANKQEAMIVAAILDALNMGGVESSEIGIISPYREQVALIRSLLACLKCEDAPSDVSTVDQFQGRDKSVIIYSCTRSEDDNTKKIKEGEILNDPRRLAVAVTRAKHKFILIGDTKTLKKFKPFESVLKSCKHIALDEDNHRELTKKYDRHIIDNSVNR